MASDRSLKITHGTHDKLDAESAAKEIETLG